MAFQEMRRPNATVRFRALKAKQWASQLATVLKRGENATKLLFHKKRQHSNFWICLHRVDWRMVQPEVECCKSCLFKNIFQTFANLLQLLHLHSYFVNQHSKSAKFGSLFCISYFWRCCLRVCCSLTRTTCWRPLEMRASRMLNAHMLSIFVSSAQQCAGTRLTRFFSPPDFFSFWSLCLRFLL